MKKGFTLIELLIVIGIIAVLAGVTFVAINPLKRFQQARNSTRWGDVTSILDAIKVHQVDNNGAYLAAVSGLTAGNLYTVGTCANGGDAGCGALVTQAACADLSGLAPSYLAAVPKDPGTPGPDAKTDYYISRSAQNVVTVGACDPEDSAVIVASR